MTDEISETSWAYWTRGPQGPTDPQGPQEPTGLQGPFFALPLRNTGIVTQRNNNLIVLKLISRFVSVS